MKLTVQIVVETENGATATGHEVVHLERGTLRPEELGLTLAEAKNLLQRVQHVTVEVLIPSEKGPRIPREWGPIRQRQPSSSRSGTDQSAKRATQWTQTQTTQSRTWSNEA